jgi:hypothetical protein
MALFALSNRQAAHNRDIVARGTRTTGTVTRLWTDGDNRRRVGYRFAVEGRVFDGRARVSDAVRRTLRVGSAVEVRYLPGSPELNDLGGTPRTAVPWPVPLIIGVLAPACGVLCLVGVMRQRRLLAEGSVAWGVVTSVSTHKSQHGSHRTLKYDFTLPSGIKASGKSEASQKSPAVGAPVLVVYEPDVPSRSRPYPFSLVRARP